MSRPALWPSQIRLGSPVSRTRLAVNENGASQLQPSVPVTRTPCWSRNSVASRPMPQPFVEKVRLPVSGAGRRVHQHDVERLERIADAVELAFDVGGLAHIAVGLVAKVEL